MSNMRSRESDPTSPEGMMTVPRTLPRALWVIAKEIESTWTTPYFGAVPYIEALHSLNFITDRFGQDDARGIVTYFLNNAKGFTGPDARRIKAELRAML